MVPSHVAETVAIVQPGSVEVLAVLAAVEKVGAGEGDVSTEHLEGLRGQQGPDGIQSVPGPITVFLHVPAVCKRHVHAGKDRLI